MQRKGELPLNAQVGNCTKPDEPRAEGATDAADFLLIRCYQVIGRSLNAVLKMSLAEVDQVSEAQVC